MHSSTLCISPSWSWLPEHFGQTRFEISQQTSRCSRQFYIVVFLVVFHYTCMSVTPSSCCHAFDLHSLFALVQGSPFAPAKRSAPRREPRHFTRCSQVCSEADWTPTNINKVPTVRQHVGRIYRVPSVQCTQRAAAGKTVSIPSNVPSI